MTIMNTMTNIDTKSSWTLTGIEYSGLGDKPYFILTNINGECKLVPIEKGVHNLRSLLDLDKE